MKRIILLFCVVPAGVVLSGCATRPVVGSHLASVGAVGSAATSSGGIRPNSMTVAKEAGLDSVERVSAGLNPTGPESTIEGKRFFTLGTLPQGSIDRLSDGKRVGIRIATMSDHLRRPEIAVRQGAHEITYSSCNSWAGRLEDVTSRALADELRRAMPDAAVEPGGGVRAVPPDIIVDADVAALEGTADGRAVFEIGWRLLGGRAGTGVRTGRYAETMTGWDGEDFSQLAEMLGALTARAGARIAADVEQIVGEGKIASAVR